MPPSYFAFFKDDFGVTGLNEAAAPFQRGVLEALGMQQMEQPISTANAVVRRETHE